jgi:hypothetical protein
LAEGATTTLSAQAKANEDMAVERSTLFTPSTSIVDCSGPLG